MHLFTVYTFQLLYIVTFLVKNPSIVIVIIN